MNYKNLFIRLILIIFFWGFNLTIAISQCAMCKATAESARDEYGNAISGGINTGIVYMMGVPYLLLALLGWVFYRDRIKGFLKDFMDIHK